MLNELVLKNRSYRRFDESFPVEKTTLAELVDLARMCGSAANRQPLKFFLSVGTEMNENIFSCLSWAGYLREWPGPAPGERPSAYIVILGDRKISDDFWCDHGIVAQTILLGAVERGLGGCMIGAVEKERLRRVLSLPDRYEILLVLALGKPAERVVVESLPPDGDIRYYRDEEDVHHVPKRSLEEIILNM